MSASAARSSRPDDSAPAYDARMRAEHERLEGIVRMKDQFIASVTHELRTALTPIGMLSELLMTAPALDDEMRDHLETIRNSATLAARLVSDLLDLSRITYGKLQLRVEPVDLHVMIPHAESAVRLDATARRVIIENDFGASSHVVDGDVDRLQQIVLNLLTNAVKFTPAGGRITVRTWNPTSRSVAISVTDTGIGISEDELARLFEPFFQAPEERSAPEHGLGLGLAITRVLVESHGGSISAASEGVGRGATFVVTLPISLGA